MIAGPYKFLKELPIQQDLGIFTQTVQKTAELVAVWTLVEATELLSFES